MIELGVLPAGDEPDRAGHKPRSPRRWLKIVALAAICLALLAGPAAAPRMDLIARIDVFGDSQFLLVDWDLVVADATGVSLYRQGERRWWLRDTPGQAYDLERHGELLVLTTGGSHITRVGVDLRTGERRWTFPGPALVAGEYLLTQTSASVMEVRTLANGALLWTLPIATDIFAVLPLLESKVDVDDCGEFDCRPSDVGAGYELLDKATGEVRFRLSGWVTLERTENGLMGRTVADGTQLFDPHTGKFASMPSGWVRLADRSLGTASARFQRKFVDTLAVKDAENGLYLGELDGDGLHVLGFLPHILVNRYSVSGRLLTYRFGHQVWWWRLTD